MARASVCDVTISQVPPCHHARSCEQFEMFMISWNHFVGDLPEKPNTPGRIQNYSATSNSIMSGTSDVILAASSSPKIFGRLFDHVPDWILTSLNSVKESLQDQRLWFRSAIFLNPVTSCSTAFDWLRHQHQTLFAWTTWPICITLITCMLHT